jgi:HD-like signal output (HDOD) protein
MSDILFIDNDDGQFDAIKKPIYGWSIHSRQTLEEGKEFLLQNENTNIVIVNVDLHGLEGIQFLSDIKLGLPEIVRFSAIANEAAPISLKASSVSNQCIAKPYIENELKVLLMRAVSLRERLSGCTFRERLHEISGLPSLPKLYKEITDEMYSPNPSLARVSELIEQDISLSAKILQVVNSAAIGLRNEVTLVSQAATLLGMEKLSSMVLLAEVYSMVGNATLPAGFSLEGLWAHSLKVANYSKIISQEAIEDRQLADSSMTAGMLHDVGMVILAAHFSTELVTVLSITKEQELTLWDAEKEVFGTTHAEIGGYLLELWGLPDPIVEAVTFHDLPSSIPEEDYPSMVPEHGFTPLTAVHVGNYFCEDERRSAYGGTEGDIDSHYLERLGFMENVPQWLEICLDADD